MCSVIVCFRPGHDWPLLMAANRDEMMDRPWLGPGRHWPDWPNLLAGKDLLAGGSWLGINDHGVVAVILNRVGTLGKMPGKTSRGLLVLEALGQKCAEQSVELLMSWLSGRIFRPFNLIVADSTHAFWIAWRETVGGEEKVSIHSISPGIHMLTGRDLDDVTDARIRGYLPQFTDCHLPDPGLDWSGWIDLLGSRVPVEGAGVESAMCFQLDSGFATVSSSLIALPGQKNQKRSVQWLFASGKPGDVAFQPVAVGPVSSLLLGPSS